MIQEMDKDTKYIYKKLGEIEAELSTWTGTPHTQSYSGMVNLKNKVRDLRTEIRETAKPMSPEGKIQIPQERVAALLFGEEAVHEIVESLQVLPRGDPEGSTVEKHIHMMRLWAQEKFLVLLNQEIKRIAETAGISPPPYVYFCCAEFKNTGMLCRKLRHTDDHHSGMQLGEITKNW